MNCNFCNAHILATTQIAWRGKNFHSSCIGDAIKESDARSPETGLPDNYFGQLEESLEDDDFFDEAEVSDEILNQIPAQQPDYRPEVHINDIVTNVSNQFVAERSGNGHSTLSVGRDAQYVDRNGLMNLPLPQATSTHQPIAHVEIVEKLIETLSFRHIQVVAEQYAISKDGMRCFGTLELNNEWDGMTYAIGFKNSNDKSCRLGMTVGMRVQVCSNLMLMGDYTPVFKKHSKSLDLIDTLSIGVDKMQRSFEPMQGKIMTWKHTKLSVKEAQLLIYRAYLENKFPMQAMKQTHQEFFNPSYEEFEGRSLFSLHNAFTTSFKQLNAMRMYQETARLGNYFQQL